jgi:hypothetical protein
MPRTVAAFVHSLIQPAVEDWFLKQCQDPATRMYAYYKPTDTVAPGEFRIASESPGPEWQPVAAEAVRTDFTRQMAQQWIYNLSGSLPILPIELDLTA